MPTTRPALSALNIPMSGKIFEGMVLPFQAQNIRKQSLVHQPTLQALALQPPNSGRSVFIEINSAC